MKQTLKLDHQIVVALARRERRRPLVLLADRLGLDVPEWDWTVYGLWDVIADPSPSSVRKLGDNVPLWEEKTREPGVSFSGPECASLLNDISVIDGGGFYGCRTTQSVRFELEDSTRWTISSNVPSIVAAAEAMTRMQR